MPLEEATHIGDIHANTLTELLVLHDKKLIKNLDQALFNKFKIAYENNDIARFLELVSQLEFDKEEIKKHKLINNGDTTGDRGKNDAFTLFLFLAMAIEGLDYDILYSNHDHELITNIYHIINEEWDKISTLIPKDQTKSLYNFVDSIKEGKISSGLVKLMLQNYLAHLKLFSLEYSPEGIAYIATHAPLCDSTVKQMLNEVMKETKKEKPSLEEIVEYLNKRFREKILPILAGPPCKEKSTYQSQISQFNKTKEDKSGIPLEIKLMWGRGNAPYDEDPMPESPLYQLDPDAHHIHGHDSFGVKLYGTRTESEKGNSTNLDNRVGKDDHINYNTMLESITKNIELKEPTYEKNVKEIDQKIYYGQPLAPFFREDSDRLTQVMIQKKMSLHQPKF